MGCTPGALQTAMSRFGLSRHNRSKNLIDPGQQKPQNIESRRILKCVNYDRPFGSGGKFNRFCIPCGGVGSRDKDMSYGT
jgi:hypothetical protein